jgi:copper resistance protein D
MLFSDPLLWARAVHFLACAAMAGTLVFVCAVAEPVFGASEHPPGAKRIRVHLTWVAGVGLVAAILSGLAWWTVQTWSAREFFPADIGFGNVAWTVLAHTRFGQITVLRGVCAFLLMFLLWREFHRIEEPSRGANFIAAGLAVALLGSLAFIGHAGAGNGPTADLHLASDVVHLVAAGTWAGGLLPLLLLLASATKTGDPAQADLARRVTLRFSMFGLIGVALLLVSGLLNASFLIGSVQDLAETDYGRVLIAKLALFTAMAALAAVNRVVLTPRLPQPAAVRQLRVTCVCELMLGITILVIAAMLGMLAPPAHIHE